MKSKYNREYYDLIELIEQKFEAGEIPAEQRDFMINEATANESERRRKIRRLANSMFPKHTEDEIEYYYLCVLDYSKEMYLSCKYTREEEEISFDNFMKFCENRHEKNTLAKNNAGKDIYEDVISGKIDLLNTTFEDYVKIYGE